MQQAQQLPPAAPGVQLAFPSILPVPPLPQSCKPCCCSRRFLWELSRKTRFPLRPALVWLPRAMQRAACVLHQNLAPVLPWQSKGVKRCGSEQARSNPSWRAACPGSSLRCTEGCSGMHSRMQRDVQWDAQQDAMRCTAGCKPSACRSGRNRRMLLILSCRAACTAYQQPRLPGGTSSPANATRVPSAHSPQQSCPLPCTPQGRPRAPSPLLWGDQSEPFHTGFTDSWLI